MNALDRLKKIDTSKGDASVSRYRAGTFGTAPSQPLKTNATADALHRRQSVSAGQRVKSMVTGAAKEAGAGYVNLGGSAVEGMGHLNTAIAGTRDQGTIRRLQEDNHRYGQMLLSGKKLDGTLVTPQERKNFSAIIARNRKLMGMVPEQTRRQEQRTQTVADSAYRKADALHESGERDVSRAKQGLGTVGRFAVDLGVAGTQMLGDAALSAAVPGAGLVSMGLRSAGSSAQQARQAGASYGQQIAYGLGSGALSMATEKLSNVAAPFRKMFGKGVLDSAIQKAAGKLGQSPAGKLALSMISEGGEEFVEDLFQPVLQRATYDKNASFDVSAALYDAAVGAALGGLGSGAEGIQRRIKGRNAASPAAESTTPEQAGTFASSEKAASERPRSAPEVMNREIQRLFGKQNVQADAQEGTQNAAPGVEAAGSPTHMTMETFTDTDSPVWRNIPYEDTAAQTAIQRETHDAMVRDGSVVQVPEETQTRVSQSFPDLQGMKKAERTPILKQKMSSLKTELRKFLSGLKGANYEFDVNGNILDAKLYNTGIREVMEKVTRDKASMLYHSDEIFKNARYLYSTPDYDGDPNIYRWNYFYTPVQIGDTVTGVRIAVRDVAKGTNLTPESQIYNWGIKKAPVDGESRDPKAASLDVSLGASSEGTRPLNTNDSIAQGAENVKNGGAAGFDTPGDAVAGAVNTDFDTMQAQSDTFHPVNPNSAQRIQSEQRRAPSEVPTVNPETGRNIGKTVSTILNSPLTSLEMASVYENEY